MGIIFNDEEFAKSSDTNIKEEQINYQIIFNCKDVPKLAHYIKQKFFKGVIIDLDNINIEDETTIERLRNIITQNYNYINFVFIKTITTISDNEKNEYLNLVKFLRAKNGIFLPKIDLTNKTINDYDEIKNKIENLIENTDFGEYINGFYFSGIEIDLNEEGEYYSLYSKLRDYIDELNTSNEKCYGIIAQIDYLNKIKNNTEIYKEENYPNIVEYFTKFFNITIFDFGIITFTEDTNIKNDLIISDSFLSQFLPQNMNVNQIGFKYTVDQNETFNITSYKDFIIFLLGIYNHFGLLFQEPINLKDVNEDFSSLFNLAYLMEFFMVIEQINLLKTELQQNIEVLENKVNQLNIDEILTQLQNIQNLTNQILQKFSQNKQIYIYNPSSTYNFGDIVIDPTYTYIGIVLEDNFQPSGIFMNDVLSGKIKIINDLSFYKGTLDLFQYEIRQKEVNITEIDDNTTEQQIIIPLYYPNLKLDRLVYILKKNTTPLETSLNLFAQNYINPISIFEFNIDNNEIFISDTNGITLKTQDLYYLSKYSNKDFLYTQITNFNKYKTINTLSIVNNFNSSIGSDGKIKYPEPIIVDKNITSPKTYNIDGKIEDEMTIILLGEGWQGGNYHFLFQTYNANGVWLNDAYYGNGFTIRQNCSFSYQYLPTPPSQQKLLAVFYIKKDYGTNFYFIDASTDDSFKNIVYANFTSRAQLCPNQYTITLGGNNSTNNNLGGIIYLALIFNEKLTLEQIIQAIKDNL